MNPRRFLLVLLVAACSPPDEEPRASVMTRGDLTIESRALPAHATLAAVGLAPEGDRRDGSSEWESWFREGEPRPERDLVRRDFRLTIVNRSATAREFHARIEYLHPDGTLLRRRSLENLVLAPFTETSWSGFALLPPPGDAVALARTLPSSEPFDPGGSP